MILDEPSAGMDSESRKGMWDVIKKYAKGRTVLLTTHYMDEAEYLADRIVVLDRGQITAAGSPGYLSNVYGNILYIYY